jgi:3-deoxy-manno-octulosonate cytidylyltransferase (CMP-KDO synthetase)
MKLCVIIPARYKSKRLPGKPLLKIKKKELLLLTYEKIRKIFKEKDIYIFSESKLIKNHFKEKIKNIFISKGSFRNGTERAAYGVKKIKATYKAALIVSCDNPYISKESIKRCISAYKSIKNDNSYCGSTIHVKNYDKVIFNSKNIAKVALNKKSDIIYLTRSPIPKYLIKKRFFYTHHGPVCLKISLLKKYLLMKNTPFQLAEDNEWLKFIENGYKIKSFLVKKILPEVNTSKDLQFYRNNKY